MTTMPHAPPTPRLGDVRLDPERRALLAAMNREVISVCRGLWASVRDAALLQLERAVGGVALRGGFIAKFHAPAWTPVRWIHHRTGRALGETVPMCCGQGLSLVLHQLDDHLADGEASATHVLLQVRTALWQRFRDLLDARAALVPDGARVAASLLDRYFARMEAARQGAPPAGAEDIVREMAIGLCFPTLAAMEAGLDVDAVHRAYAGLGIAWRTLDDVIDAEDDARVGRRTSVWAALSGRERGLWEGARFAERGAPRLRALAERLWGSGTFHRLLGRARGALQDAAREARSLGLDGLAREYDQLAAPLGERAAPDAGEGQP